MCKSRHRTELCDRSRNGVGFQDKESMDSDYSNVRETVLGKCSDIDGEPMYREIGRIEAPGHIGTGVYVLSLFDTLYPNMTCVMVTVHCDKRTKTNLWIDKGFHQDDLEHLIKTVPILGRNTTVPPKILFIKDRYSKYENYETTNIIFKFEFTGKAKIVVEFFGQKIENKEEEPKFDDEDFLLRSARKCLF
ncbi:uncharacterized protein LOC123703057 [Colias croceus]|uniref:uncharacterized protein LOC123703057 n=1 Tax=Colias crocea TaxID=72248 RepID=UPI001E27ADFA|nr:uncharacterized protein LOC123703057 [Colias croceus]